MKKALIIGYGSIGARHFKILQSLGLNVAVVSSHFSEESFCYKSIDDALSEFNPDYAVISNETSKHLSTVKQLKTLGFTGNLLVEKPIFSELNNENLDCFDSVSVAYNLRFHPLVLKLKDLIKNEEIISSQFYVGQHLSGWRPQRDYRSIYSASSDAGGGVLLDLSHDLDLISFLLGDYIKLATIGGKYSDLEITSEDVYGALISTSLCPVTTLQMNYIDRRAKRRILINTNKNTFELDIGEGRFYINEEVQEFDISIDESYRNMHISILDKTSEAACSLDEGIKILEVIEKCLMANKSKDWVVL